MEQHPVPQHIASFQFKLFGNLTVRQFMMLVGPMTIAGIIFFSEMEPVIVKYFLAGAIGLAGFFVALVPVGGRPFDKWIVAFIKAVFAPTQRIWIKEKQIPEFLSVVTTPVVDEKIPEEVTEKGRERLLAYLKSLPKDNQSPLDTREAVALSGLNFNVETVGAANIPAPIVWPSSFEVEREQIKRNEDVFSSEDDSSEVQVKVAEPVAISSFQEIPKKPGGRKVQKPPQVTSTAMAQVSTKPGPVTPTRVKIHPSAKPFSLQGIEDRLSFLPGNKPSAGKHVTRVEQMHVLRRPRLKAHLASDGNFELDNIISVVEPDSHIKFVRGVGKTRVRKLHFAPPANFDLSKLPIRGERRFEISEELKRRFSFADESPQVVLPNERSVVDNKMNLDTSGVGRDISQVLPKQVGVVSRTPAPKAKVQINPEVVNRVSDTQSRFAVTDTKKQEDFGQALTGAQIIPLTSVPNVISGLVTDDGGTPIEGAVLVLRDATGIPVRALKTNKLGQFLSATPLANGAYTIEVESDVAAFKAVNLNLSGQIVSPIGLKGEAKVSN